MKVTRENHPFQPVSITLETQDELDRFQKTLRFTCIHECLSKPASAQLTDIYLKLEPYTEVQGES